MNQTSLFNTYFLLRDYKMVRDRPNSSRSEGEDGGGDCDMLLGVGDLGEGEKAEGKG